MRHLRHIAMALCLWLSLFVSLAFAQTSSPDYSAWQDVAERVETALDSDTTTIADLEALRSELVEWRQTLLQAQSSNRPRITALQAQLTALGDPPEDSTELPGIATRRAELESQLSEAQAPARRAEAEFIRVESLSSELVSALRERDAARLTDLGPSPLNPVYWDDALVDLRNSIFSLRQELFFNLSNPAKREIAWSNLPGIVLLIALGGMFIWRGPTWVRRAIDRLRKVTRRGTGVWSFVVSLGVVILPVVGLAALVEAAMLSGFFGPRWSRLLELLPVWAAVLLGLRWLGEQSFSRNDDVATMPIAQSRRTEARYYVNAMSILIVLRDSIDALIQFDDYSGATAAVLDFPILLLNGLVLFRLAQILAQSEEAAPEDQDRPPMFRMRLARALGRLLMLLSVVGPILAAIGYGQVGQSLGYPGINTLALGGAVLVLQRFVSDFYVLITGHKEDAQQGLTPVLLGSIILIAALPVLALIWGARVTDLTELWVRFQEGFAIGDTRISPSDFMTFLVVFAIGYAVTRLLQGGLRTSILPRTKIDLGGRNAIVSGMGYVGIGLAILIGVSAAGLDLTSLAFVAGALSVGIGFGLQNIVQNFVSGIILLVERPISEGDWIEVGENMGIVKDISVRSTRIETFDRTDVIVPNGDFVSGTVTNYTRGNVLGRVFVKVGVAYGTDTREVESILLRITREHPMVLVNPAPSAYFAGFGVNSLDFEIRAILRDVNYVLQVKSDLLHEINKQFAEKGIEIPFAQRDLWLRNPEVLPGARQTAPVAPSGNVPEPAASRVDQRGYLTSDDIDGQADQDGADGADGGGNR